MPCVRCHGQKEVKCCKLKLCFEWNKIDVDIVDGTNTGFTSKSASCDAQRIKNGKNPRWICDFFLFLFVSFFTVSELLRLCSLGLVLVATRLCQINRARRTWENDEKRKLFYRLLLCALCTEWIRTLREQSQILFALARATRVFKKKCTSKPRNGAIIIVCMVKMLCARTKLHICLDLIFQSCSRCSEALCGTQVTTARIP